MLSAEALSERAREYDLRARAYADMPDAEARKAAGTFAVVALVLYELAELENEDEGRAA